MHVRALKRQPIIVSARYIGWYNKNDIAVLANLYQDISEDALAVAFASAWRDLRADPRTRARGLPPAVSAELSSQARALLQCSQREAERLLYGADDDAARAADSRDQRYYEAGGRALSFEKARNALTSMAWGALMRSQPEWLDFVERWWMRLDFVEAAQEAVKSVRRRLDPSNPAEVLDAFHMCLMKQSRLAELEGDVRLKRWAAEDAAASVLAQICHTAGANSVQFERIRANVSQ